MSTKNEKVDCPICSLNDTTLINTRDRGGDCEIECPICGKYWITRSSKKIPDNFKEKSKLSAWIREKNLFYDIIPEFDSRNIKSIIENLPYYSTSQKQIILLRALRQKSKYPGDKVQLNEEQDFPLAWADNANEFRFYLQSISMRGFVELDSTLDHFTANISHAGWEYLDKYGELPAFQNQVFIAMSFSKALEEAWEKGIKPAVEKAGYKPYRIDKIPHIERIDAKIITEIKNSKFLIADVTEQKNGVYYEAGFAQGLKRPVIWSVRNDEIDEVHFDTKTFNHIVWETPKELSQELYYRICATIGESRTQK
ncbi:MAG: hypothetical protein KQI78_14505 [Deltaproteobacteria bacterium]|nr:hypothetical protein [Deltaproteobacteria bacterium]